MVEDPARVAAASAQQLEMAHYGRRPNPAVVLLLAELLLDACHPRDSGCGTHPPGGAPGAALSTREPSGPEPPSRRSARASGARASGWRAARPGRGVPPLAGRPPLRVPGRRVRRAAARRQRAGVRAALRRAAGCSGFVGRGRRACALSETCDAPETVTTGLADAEALPLDETCPRAALRLGLPPPTVGAWDGNKGCTRTRRARRTPVTPARRTGAGGTEAEMRAPWKTPPPASTGRPARRSTISSRWRRDPAPVGRPSPGEERVVTKSTTAWSGAKEVAGRRTPGHLRYGCEARTSPGPQEKFHAWLDATIAGGTSHSSGATGSGCPVTWTPTPPAPRITTSSGKASSRTAPAASSA